MKLPRFLFGQHFLFSIIALIILAGVVVPQITQPISTPRADEIEDLQKQINDLAHLKQLSEAATTPLESQVKDLDSKIKNAQNGIAAAKKNAQALAESITRREKDLAVYYVLLKARVKSQYKQLRTFSPLLLVISSSDASEISKGLAYHDSIRDQNQQLIMSVGEDITQLELDKKDLEQRQITLAALQKQLDGQVTFFKGEITKAKDYQQSLTGQIAALSAKQQEILNARSGNFTASIGDSELADDYNASIKGFRESAPGGSFAVFSFGAYTHRKGMSQYGARGRAENGQLYPQILKAYYGKEPVSKDTGSSIDVAGYGSMDFETTYLYGIAEMPSSWNAEALKAQAVAARTYAYRYKEQGKQICTTEACQVFRKSKSDSVPEAWKNAVDSTKGQVLEDVTTYYASTHGGYASPIGWDTTDGSGGSNFVDKSYDKLGGSPWLYKAWYTKGYSPSSDKCGHANPWLSGEDLADIVNAAKYRDDRVTPITTACWGGNPYSHDELRQKADGPRTVTSVRVEQGNGTSNRVVFQTDKGEISLTGSEFKTAFNIRAPGYLAIPQSGFGFYNIEQK